MSRKKQRVRYTLDTGDIQNLSEEEIRAILRAADELISVGGRSMLVKILKGSKDKRLLEHDLQNCPAYGYYQPLTMAEIGHRVDWVIRKGYLRIQYDRELPLLVFSDKGWEIERETYAEELFRRFCLDVEEKNARVLFEMPTVNRQVAFRVLEKLEETGDPKFLPLLQAWKLIDVRKGRERISAAERILESAQTYSRTKPESVISK